MFGQVLLDNSLQYNKRILFMPCSMSEFSKEKLRGRREHKQTTEQENLNDLKFLLTLHGDRKPYAKYVCADLL